LPAGSDVVRYGLRNRAAGPIDPDRFNGGGLSTASNSPPATGRVETTVRPGTAAAIETSPASTSHKRCS